jgi:hypothetical protein
MFAKRGEILTVGLPSPEANLLTSTSASPVTGERM